MLSKKLAPSLIKSHSRVFHATTINNANSILDSTLIFGTDKGQHANFSVSGNTQVARYNEVVLEFHWYGEHETMSTPGLDFSPMSWENGPRPNVLYHCDNGNIDGYLQSNLFPGSAGLVFIAAKPSFDTAKKQKLWKRLLSSKGRQDHKNYLYQQSLFKHWDSLKNTPIGVTYWDKTMPRKYPYS